jgi:hypothetical protein
MPPVVVGCVVAAPVDVAGCVAVVAAADVAGSVVAGRLVEALDPAGATVVAVDDEPDPLEPQPAISPNSTSTTGSTGSRRLPVLRGA